MPGKTDMIMSAACAAHIYTYALCGLPEGREMEVALNMRAVIEGARSSELWRYLYDTLMKLRRCQFKLSHIDAKKTSYLCTFIFGTVLHRSHFSSHAIQSALHHKAHHESQITIPAS